MDTYDAVFYTFTFLVPGYIIDEVMRTIMPLKQQQEGARMLRCLVYSVFNYAVWFSWGIKIIDNYFESDTYIYWVIMSLSVIITGIITGFVFGFIQAKDCIYSLFNKVFGKYNITMTHPIPTAWDYVFKNMREGAWVTIRMDNGKFVRGLYHANSMASSDESYRDIYIEKAFILKDENWEPVPYSKGIWVNADAIRHIEFKELGVEKPKNNKELKIECDNVNINIQTKEVVQ